MVTGLRYIQTWKKCDDDAKNKKPDTNKQKNTDGIEDIFNRNKNDTIDTNDEAKRYDTWEHDVNANVLVAKDINENKTDDINNDAPDK